jgi:two-component system sensor histidine kinase/response regulator
MTAHTMIGDRDKCLASGMDDYIVKPLRLASLTEICDQLLESSAEPRQRTEAPVST